MNRLIREHRGGLAESMKTARPVRDRDELAAVVRKSLPFGHTIETRQITVEPYCFDDRMGWDTYLICIEGCGGIWGLANGPIP